MKLTVRRIDAAKPKEKPYKLSDGGGLYLEVTTNNSHYWRLKYRYTGKDDINSTLPGFYRQSGRGLSLVMEECKGAWIFATSNVPSLYFRKR